MAANTTPAPAATQAMYGNYEVGANNVLSQQGPGGVWAPVAAQNTATGAAASMDPGTIAQHMYDAGIAQGRSAASLQSTGQNDINYWEDKIQGQGGLTPYWQGRLDTGNQAGPAQTPAAQPLSYGTTAQNTAPSLINTTQQQVGGGLGQVNSGGNQAAIQAALAPVANSAPTGQ